MSAILKNAWARVAIIAVVIIAVAVAVNIAANGNFLRPANLINVLQQISYSCILAIGQTFVIITAGIDLSLGSLISLTGVVMARIANVLPFTGTPLVIATLLCGIVVGAIAGWINSIPVVKLNLHPFITTFAMLGIAVGLSRIVSNGSPIELKSDAFSGVGSGTFLRPLTDALHLPSIPMPVIWMAVIAIVAAVVLHRTRFGRYVFAIGGNEEAARLAGVPTGRIKTLVYVISGVGAAIVGFMYMSRFNTGDPNTGVGDELLEAIAAVVVGGTSLMGGVGSIVGTFLGALLIGLLYNAMNLIHVDPYLQKVVLGLVILLAVTADALRKRYLVK